MGAFKANARKENHSHCFANFPDKHLNFNDCLKFCSKKKKMKHNPMYIVRPKRENNKDNNLLGISEQNETLNTRKLMMCWF